MFLNWFDNRVEEWYQSLFSDTDDKQGDMLQVFIDAKDMSGNPVKKGDVVIKGVKILGAGAGATTIIDILHDAKRPFAEPRLCTTPPERGYSLHRAR